MSAVHVAESKIAPVSMADGTRMARKLIHAQAVAKMYQRPSIRYMGTTDQNGTITVEYVRRKMPIISECPKPHTHPIMAATVTIRMGTILAHKKLATRLAVFAINAAAVASAGHIVANNSANEANALDELMARSEERRESTAEAVIRAIMPIAAKARENAMKIKTISNAFLKDAYEVGVMAVKKLSRKKTLYTLSVMAAMTLAFFKCTAASYIGNAMKPS